MTDLRSYSIRPGAYLGRKSVVVGIARIVEQNADEKNLVVVGDDGRTYRLWVRKARGPEGFNVEVQDGDSWTPCPDGTWS